MDILEVKDQNLSLLIANYLICKNCLIVDRKIEWSRKGFPCPNCGKPSDAGRIFFSNGIQSLIDLMQEFYHHKNIENKKSDENNHLLAVIVFFTSLGEVLFDKFLIDFMRESNISERLIEKILSDNQSFARKLDLYKSLTKYNFQKDIGSFKSQYNFTTIISFYREVRDVRNKILHKGFTWLIPKNMPEKCIKNAPGLLNLFVLIHNKYIAKVN